MPVAKGLPVTGEDQLRAEVIERLMCDGRVDATKIGQRHGASVGWWIEALPALQEMAADGLVTLSDGTVAMTPQGWPFVRIAATAFDAYPHASTAAIALPVNAVWRPFTPDHHAPEY